MPEKTLRDRISGNITALGLLVASLGMVSAVITFLGYELRILMWIDQWGPLVAWTIRGTLVVGGVLLAIVANLFDRSQSPEALAAAEQAQLAAWEQLKSHPKVQQLLADVAQRLRTSWDSPLDPETYQIRQFAWQDAAYRWADQATGKSYGPDDPRVTNVAMYLERQNVPRRVVVTQDLASRQVAEQEAHPATWTVMVG